LREEELDPALRRQLPERFELRIVRDDHQRSILREVNDASAETKQIERASALSELVEDTPELVLDLDTVRANIDRVADQARAAGVTLRPHTKTHKLPQIARLQLEAGAVGRVTGLDLAVDGGQTLV